MVLSQGKVTRFARYAENRTASQQFMCASGVGTAPPLTHRAKSFCRRPWFCCQCSLGPNSGPTRWTCPAACACWTLAAETGPDLTHWNQPFIRPAATASSRPWSRQVRVRSRFNRATYSAYWSGAGGGGGGAGGPATANAIAWVRDGTGLSKYQSFSQQ